jgi:hypothetical protein
MNPRAPAWASFLVLLALVGSSNAQLDDSAVKSRILAMENIWNQAEKLGDLKTLDVLFDRDLAYIDSDGALLTKAELLASIRSEHLQSLATETTSIQVFDDTAIVNGTYQVKELRNGKLLYSKGRYTDTWIYKGSSWVCIAAQATPILPAKGN